jgi:hypothetical protein
MHDRQVGAGDPLATALAIARLARDAGGRALIVGGWVRDRLLGRSSKDVDVEVFGIEAARLRVLLESIGPVNAVGESFTVYKVGGVDVSPTRRFRSSRRRDAAISRSTPSPGTRSRTTTSIRSGAVPIWPGAACATSTTAPSRTTACACCAPCSSPRASI